MGPKSCPGKSVWNDHYTLRDNPEERRYYYYYYYFILCNTNGNELLSFFID